MILRPFSSLPLLAFLLTAQARGQGAVFNVEENGPRHERINFVFLSEGYSAADLPNFAGHVDAAVAYLFSREPWKQYRSYCNLYRIEIASAQSGCDNGSAGGLRDTYFNCGFNTPGVPQLITSDVTGQVRAFNLLVQFVPEVNIPIFIVNDTKYGGGGGTFAIATTNDLSAQIVEHEVGHSFAGLGDEYDTYYAESTPDEYPNVTAETVRNLVKWNAWVDAITPEPTPATSDYDSIPGLFEGANYRPVGWYRPHYNSLMRNLGRPTGQINREQFVLSIYSSVHPIESQSPAGSGFSADGFQHLSFSIVPKQPVFWSIQTKWSIDGQPVAGATSNNFDVVSDVLGNGTHTVAAQAVDPTTFVRNDPYQLLQQTASWSITLTNQLPADLPAWRSAYGPDAANPAGDGIVNLMKYALGIDAAKVAPVSQQPTWSIAGIAPAPRYLTLSVPRRTKRSDVSYIVESSSDLSTWDAGISVVTVEDRDDLFVVRDAFPFGSLPSRFLRLRIVVP